MEQVVEAAKIANAHDFIMEKPEGYNMNIGDRVENCPVVSASDQYRPCHPEEPSDSDSR